MTQAQRLKNLEAPKGKIDVVLDTDAYNEIDDQFAIAYLLSAKEKLSAKAIYAAPFLNKKSTSAADGMQKSYDEILKLLSLMGEDVPVLKGSENYLADEATPTVSPAAKDLAQRAEAYSPEHPLYVVAIGAITNVASAILLNPKVAENTVVVWLGGHGRDFHDTKEFNMMQDIAAARVVMGSGVPFVQLPCMGVVSAFTASGPELERYFLGKSPIATYLAENTAREVRSYVKEGRAWSRVIWDVTAVAWLLLEGDAQMLSRVVPVRLPGYDFKYEDTECAHVMRYVYYIRKDGLFNDLIARVANR